MSSEVLLHNIDGHLSKWFLMYLVGYSLQGIYVLLSAISYFSIKQVNWKNEQNGGTLQNCGNTDLTKSTWTIFVYFSSESYE